MKPAFDQHLGLQQGLEDLPIQALVSHRTRKNFQLDFFDPNDGHYEYSSVATNRRVGLRALWEFMAGRRGHEKTPGELKQHLAFDDSNP